MYHQFNQLLFELKCNIIRYFQYFFVSIYLVDVYPEKVFIKCFIEILQNHNFRNLRNLLVPRFRFSVSSTCSIPACFSNNFYKDIVLHSGGVRVIPNYIILHLNFDATISNKVQEML